jgi:hypothetical protein
VIAGVTPNIPHNLRDYFNRVYWPRKLGRKLRTKALYGYTIDVYERWLNRPDTRETFGREPGPATLDDLNDGLVCAFLGFRIETVSAYSATKNRDNLLAIAKFAASKRHIPEFLDVPPIPVAMPQPTAHRPEQFAALLTACRETPGMIGGSLACDWWTALHAVMLFTGERTAATLAIQWEWLSPDGWLSIPAKVRKGGKKSMTYKLPEGAMRLIEKLHGNGSEYIFAQPWATTNGNGTFYHRYNALLKRAGLPTGRRWKPQMIRRTFASYVNLLGLSATDLLAHDSPRVTKASYLDPTISEAAQPGDLLATLFAVG